MQLHNLTSKTKFRESRRIGRGGKRGTFSGRGIKGMGARAGAKYRPAEREILKKIPKLRGYRFNSFTLKPEIVNILELNKRFNSGDVITPQVLVKAGLVKKRKGKIPAVKILGKGESSKIFVFKDVVFSASAAGKLKVPFIKGNKPEQSEIKKEIPVVVSSKKKQAKKIGK